ncbi:MAG TPA: hypothetical protein VF807_09735 [Ktedonobacterales bacterium]
MSDGKNAAVWRHFGLSHEPMGRQLALAEALLEHLTSSRSPALRWYVPDEQALVMGNGQKPGLAKPELCEAAGVRVYRRSSGGAAVRVDEHLLNLDILLPAGHALDTSDVVEAYRWLGEVWEDALQALGVEKAHVIPVEDVRKLPPLEKDDPLRLACYGTLSPYEVVVGKRKLVGLCQVRRRGGTLYQAGVYVHFEPKALSSLLDLNNNTRKRLGTRLHNAALGLDQATDQPPAMEAVIAAFEASLRARTGATFSPGSYSEAEEITAGKLMRDRFAAFF